MNNTAKTDFERLTRIPADQVDPDTVGSWQPPTIDHDGHIVQAMGKSWSRSAATAAAQSPKSTDSADDFESDEVLRGREFEKARNAGFDEGRREGFEAGEKKGIERGEETGYAEGMARAQEEYRVEMEAKLSSVNMLLTHLSHCMNEQDYNLEQALFNCVKALSKAVLRKELALDPRRIMEAVSDIIKSLPPSRDNIKIYCSTSDKTLIQEAARYGGENWSVFEAFDVESGGCRVVTDQSVVDYTVSRRFEEAVAKMLENRLIINDSNEKDFEQAADPVIQGPSSLKPGPESTKELATETEARPTGDGASLSPEPYQDQDSTILAEGAVLPAAEDDLPEDAP